MHRSPAILLGSLVLAFAASANAAPSPSGSTDLALGRACGTPEPVVADLDQARLAVRRWAERFGAGRGVGPGGRGEIAVAFHVIHAAQQGNVSDQQIADQIEALNDGFRGTGYTFRLASVDRTQKPGWFHMVPGSNAEIAAKQALATDPAHHLNIYTCKPGARLLGWSYFPWSAPEGHFIHGVVIHFGSLPGGPLAPFDLGGTAVHEAGHYLGLLHTFQNGCVAPGDEVSDTPDEATPTSGCPEGKDTCPAPGLDPIHNYMDYSTDACYTEFTRGQDDRMDALVPVYRPSLFERRLASAAGAAAMGPSSVIGPSFRGATPNPFSGETWFRIFLPQDGHATLAVYNVAGQRVATLVDGVLGAGEHEVAFRASSLPPGMYFAALRVGGRMEYRRVLLAR